MSANEVTVIVGAGPRSRNALFTRVVESASEKF
jgi:hypothetical protein